MSVMKKFALFVLFIMFMYFGGQGTQSSSSLLQGMGAFGVVFALILLFILFKFLKMTFRLLPSVLMLVALGVFIFYCLGSFSSDSSLEKSQQQYAEDIPPADSEYSQVQETGTMEDVFMFGSGDVDEKTVSQQQPQQQPQTAQQQQNGGLVGAFNELMFGTPQQPQPVWSFERNFNPEDYPSVSGHGVALSGSTLRIGKLKLRLLGIEAPVINQTCADKYGHSYNCGQKAKIWLQDWMEDKTVTCNVISKVINNGATGVCFAEGYDIAAVVTNAGWAVAYPKNTDIYVPYEEQANINRRGLWAGKFYKPWDWRKIQSRKVNVQIEDDSSFLDSITSSFSGWF